MSARGRNRVLVYVHNLELGGNQINAVDLASGVRDFGYECLVVGPSDMRPAGASLFDVAAAKGVELRGLERYETVAQEAQNLSRIAEAYGADLLHMYGSWSARPAYWGPCLLGRRALVLTVYEMQIDPITYQAPHLIVGAGYLLDDLRGRAGSVHLVSPPVDLDADHPDFDYSSFVSGFGLDQTRTRVVIVSRLDGEPLRPVKSTGVDHAIQAVERLAREDVELVIVGSGNCASDLMKKGEEVNQRLGGRYCVFTGPLSDPRPAYASADIVIGMGGSAARGLAFGKPLIVAGEFGWYRTFTPDSSEDLFRSSFWSEARVAGPVDMLVEELKPILGSPSERQRLGKYGRQFAHRFGLVDMSRRLSGIYDQARADYGLTDWLYDQRSEGRWAAGWLARHVRPAGRLAKRLSYPRAPHVGPHD